MDPQACLFLIMQLVHTARRPCSDGDRDEDWSKLTHAFEDLAEWLRKGGCAPAAAGPLFGTGPRSVGYPGMSLNSLQRYEERVICHVASSTGSWRYAIMTTYDQSAALWVMCEYNHKGDEINRWLFPPVFTCPSCKSTGFHNSHLAADRCTRCDGTIEGHPPDDD